MTTTHRDRNSQDGWQRLLWVRHPYEDNFVPSSFLDQLRVNEHVKKRGFIELASETSIVSRQFSTVVIFAAVFYLVMIDVITTKQLLWIDVCLSLVGFTLRRIKDPSFHLREMYSSIRAVCLLMVAIFSLSPILNSLTQTISTDTVTVWSFVLLLIHLYSYDYDYDYSLPSARSTSPVSLNSANFAAVLLASRLTDTLAVFAVICFAYEIFALLPFLRRQIKKASKNYNESPLLVWMMIAVIIWILSTISMTILGFYLLVIFTITFLAPCWFIYNQHRRRVIHGPWDEYFIGVDPE